MPEGPADSETTALGGMLLPWLAADLPRTALAVLAVDTPSAKRLTLYLDPSDHRTLGLARLDDDADANTRIRAMIACWRADAALRARISRLAAPRVVATAGAKRMSLYLHPIDRRALGLARLDDGTDANARIRAMIALWRSTTRLQARVNRLAVSSRGGGRR